MPVNFNGQPVSAAFRQQLFLIFKEALHNIVKHSRAGRVEIELALEDGKLRLVIQDNGRGMAADGKVPFHHGLDNMRARAERLGGVLELESSPGRGLRITVTAPFPET
jgi:signal transduction histidine kinase